MTTRKSSLYLWISSVMFCLFLAACASGTPGNPVISDAGSSVAPASESSERILLKVPVPEPFASDFCARIRVSGSDFPEIIMDKVYPPETTSVEGVVPNIKAGENRTVELGLFSNGVCADLSLADWYGIKTGVSINASDVTIVQIALQKFQEHDTGSVVVRGDKNLIMRRLHGEVVMTDTSPIGSALCRIVENGILIGTVNSGIDTSNLGVLNTLVEVNPLTTQLELFCTHPLFSQQDQEFAALIPVPTDPLFGGTFIATVEMTAAAASLPSFIVTGNPVTEAASAQLQKALGLSINPLAQDGSIRFVDAANFLALPAVQSEGGANNEDGQSEIREFLNFEAIKLLPFINQSEALKMSQAALRTSGLATEVAGGLMQPSIQTDHTMFEAIGADGEVIAKREVDTQVRYSFFLNGIPVIGPGAKVSMSFNGEGKPTEVNYALRSVQQGEMMPLIPVNQGNRLAKTAFLGAAASDGLQGRLKMSTPQVVYFAPSMSFFDVFALYPHYLYSGSILVGTQEVALRNVLVPAVNAAPSVSLDVTISGRLIMANAIVTGGKGPFTFSWESSSTELDPVLSEQGPESIEYNLNPKENITSETVRVQVTDANGLTAQAIGTVAVLAPPPIRLLAKGGVIDFGASWIGTCGGLPGAAADAAGFVNTMQAAGFTKQFNWGNNNAWEQDFKDSSFPGGDDHNYADNTDMAFYTGHANGNGFTFCNSSHTDDFISFNDARWGNLGQDMEWLVVAACGPLQPTSSGLLWWQRWGPSFDGLHLMLAYATTSYDNTVEGRLLAEWMLGKKILFVELPPLPVRSAWVQAARGSQPSGVKWAIMGVLGAGGISNYNDYFHSRGPVGPDIRGGNKVGYWRLSGSS